MKVAIVHDYLNQYGGAEKTVEVLHDLYPEAPIFTSIFLPERLPPIFSAWDIRPSFMQNLPFLHRHFKKYLLLYPSAIERFNLKGFDLILSSSSAFAKGARRPEGACHISYCYSPMRFGWELQAYIDREEFNIFYKALLPLATSHLKKWDIATLDRVDHFIAISQHVKRKIKTIYQRDAEVIYPPVNLSEFFISEKPDDYFLIVSRLNAYKRIDIAIEAFNQLSLPLLIIGKGPFENALKKKANKNIVFLGEIAQRDLPGYFSRCRAFIFPGQEDFGIAPVEAMASGRPVIAYGQGGAVETVAEGLTGTFFQDQTASSLVEAVNRFNKTKYDSKAIRQHVLQFDKEIFKRKIMNYVSEKINRPKTQGSTFRP